MAVFLRRCGGRAIVCGGVEQGNLDDGCATWTQALDIMDGIQSGRARQTARDMRAALSPFRRRHVRAAEELDTRAAAYLEASA